mmetsp:Transcript_57389/g.140064  ORF Transcript_57389/g.140064 Transcript_57389/m.140064 type:complete len:374 (-) Transcript_57389:172-1293(-)
MCIYDVYGPCSCPHGRCYTVLAQCFTVSSWVTSLMAITSCFYVMVRPIPEEGMPELPREGFGYISRQVMVQEPPAYRQCTWYDRDDKDLYFDSMWNAGKAMGLLACGIGGIVMCLVLCTCCVAFELPTFDGLFWTCMVCFVAQCLTFLSWGSDLCQDGTYECTWANGTGMQITAAMLWVWAANMIKSFPEALPPRKRGRQNNPGRRFRRGPSNNNDDDEDWDNEDSPYLPASQRNGGFQDEYDDDEGEAEYDDYYDNGEEEVDFDYDDPNNGDGGYDGYYDEDGNWVDGGGDEYDDDGQQQPNGYYGDDGEWYDYDNAGDGGGEYYDGEYDDGQEQDPFAYDNDPSVYASEPSPEEMEFLGQTASQRSINQLD